MNCEKVTDLSSISVQIDTTDAVIILDSPARIVTTVTPSRIAHEHFAPELYCIERGTVTVECDGKLIDILAGEILLIKEHIEHHVVACSKDASRLTCRFLLHSGEDWHYDIPHYLHYVPDKRDAGDIFHSVKCLLELLNDTPDKYELFRVKAYFGVIFSYLLGRLPTAKGAIAVNYRHMLSLYVKIDDFFYKYSSNHITVDSLAAYLNYSRAQTNRIVKEYSGKSFSQVLQEKRIYTAINLLMRTDTSIDEIASVCGYETRQGFEAMFQKYMGTTPKGYRLSLK